MKEIILKKNTRIYVVGDIQGHLYQFEQMLEKINPSETRRVAFVGDYFEKGYGPEAEKTIIRKIRKLCEKGIGYAVKGNHEAKAYKKAKKISEELEWAYRLPLSIVFQFAMTRNRLTVLHAGVTPAHTWNDLENNSDVIYIRTLDEKGEYIPLTWVNGELKPTKSGKPWHELYDGRFGYIAAGHNAQKDGIPKFWPHSCNLDTAVYQTGILTAQEFTDKGLGELIQVSGPAANPNFTPSTT